MSDRIKITPAELESQANKLYALGHQFDDITLKAGKAMRLIEEALSSKFTSNMEKKSATLMKNIRSLRDSLYIGSKVAFQCATSYQHVDKVLRDEIGDFLPDDVINNPASNQESYSLPQLKHNMKNPISQYDAQYDATFRYPQGYNAGCCATVYATGLSIVNGCNYNPTDYWYNGTTHYDEGGISDYIHGFDTNSIYQSLLNGKPTMCHYGHNLEGGQHYVLITGVTPNADPSNLSYKDFIAIDPKDGTEQSFAELENSYPGLSIWGYHLFT